MLEEHISKIKDDVSPNMQIRKSGLGVSSLALKQEAALLSWL